MPRLRRLIILTAVVVLLLLGIALQLQFVPLVPIVQKYLGEHRNQSNISQFLVRQTSPTTVSPLTFLNASKEGPTLDPILYPFQGDEIKCKPHRPDKAGTEQIVRHYGQPGRVENRKCDETHYADICSFHVTESGDNKLSCDAKVCGSSDAQIASVNPEMGKAVSDWKPLPKDTMTATVQEAIKTNLEKGFSFLFIRCGSIFQALTFPPILKKVEDGKREVVLI
ncbi:hypothetical protein OS493_034155 [Desmophyllum pertusum]|uniref:Uncharacterized protein n=1 Tax=Desmophyllum pertusum TaxID=174260 RepID=A0A9X0D753_9CNID|nr:hypothetical protein OS493_034155 [Desmophyllum pertusum]